MISVRDVNRAQETHLAAKYLLKERYFIAIRLLLHKKVLAFLRESIFDWCRWRVPPNFKCQGPHNYQGWIDRLNIFHSLSFPGIISLTICGISSQPFHRIVPVWVQFQKGIKNTGFIRLRSWAKLRFRKQRSA